MGIERKNENSSAAARESPADCPAAIVAIERLVPLIQEPRLLGAVRRLLGPQVDEIREGPDPPEEKAGPHPTDAGGIPVAVFPRWLRCPICSLLAEVDSGHFELRSEPFQVDRLRYIHANCTKRGALREAWAVATSSHA